jgi:hypothetical protein
MFHEMFHFVLINGVRVASAILPAAPLLGQKLPPVSVVKNIVPVQGAFADGPSLEVGSVSLRSSSRRVARGEQSQR